MDTVIKTSLWQQFGATIDMLDSAIRACPDELWAAQLWDDPDGEHHYAQFWNLIYHTLFYLDLYVAGGDFETHQMPPPFVRGVFPETPYPKEAMLAYLRQSRHRCQEVIEAMTDEDAGRICRYDWVELSYFELMLYNMRHVQEHTAQLNMFLGHHNIRVEDWITRVDGE